MTTTAFNIAMLFKADPAAAIAALKAVGVSADAVGGEVEKMAARGKQALDKVAEAGRKAKEKLGGPSPAPLVPPVPAIPPEVPRSYQVTGQQIAYMTSQFNDVLVMMAAGQNPFQLALQQGTQLTQAFATMGGGAQILRGVGSAFVSMINPISLVTIGSIAAGSAMINWLSSAGPEAKSLEDRLTDLDEAVKRYVESSDRVTASQAEMRDEFGRLGEAVRAAGTFLAEIDKADALDRLREATKGLADELGATFEGGIADDAFGSPDMSAWEAALGAVRNNFDLTREDALTLTRAIEGISQAATPDEAVAASTRFNDALVAIYGTADQIPGALRDAARAADEMARRGGAIAAAEGEAAQAAGELLAKIRETAAARIAETAAAQRDGYAMLARYQNELQMQQLVVQFGRDSIEVKRAEAAAEDEVLRTRLRQSDIAQALQAEIVAAWRATEDSKIASDAWAGAMAGVRAEVAGILSALASIGGTAIANAARNVEIEALKAGQSVAEARRAAVKAEIEWEYTARTAGTGNILRDGIAQVTAYLDREAQLRGVAQEEELAGLRKTATERERIATKAARGAGAASAKQDKALSDLIERELAELAILRETDPVQKELLRNRQALVGVISDERQAVADLIAERLAEERAVAQAQERTQFWGQTTLGVFDDLIVKGGSLREVFASVASALASAFLQSAVLGTGPFGSFLGGSLFGLGGGPSLFGGTAGAAAASLATPASVGRVSSVRAAAAAPVSAASGGSSRSASAEGGALVIDLRLTDDLDARVAAGAERVAVRVTRAGIDQYDARAMPDRVQQVSRSPRIYK